MTTQYPQTSPFPTSHCANCGRSLKPGERLDCSACREHIASRTVDSTSDAYSAGFNAAYTGCFYPGPEPLQSTIINLAIDYAFAKLGDGIGQFHREPERTKLIDSFEAGFARGWIVRSVE